MASLAKVAAQVDRLLGSLAEEVAREVPVVKRRRKFTPATLARTFILGFLAKPRASDEDLARMAVRCGVDVSTQAVEQRFTAVMADFLEALFRRAICQRVQSDRVVASLLERFPAVLMLDSTAIALPRELKDRFPGCGGSYGGGQAVIKVQAQFDLRGGAFDALAIESGRDCDQRTPLQTAPKIAAALRIADLGYFDTEVFRHMNAEGTFWISRLAFGTEIFTPEGTPIAGIEELFSPSKRVVDQAILMGKKAKVACRIVIWRVPQEVADRRRQKLLATAREKGNPPPSRKRLDWCDWLIFVTNVPVETLSPEEIGVLYRARWQIELMFKRWKSLGRIDEMTGSTVTRQLVRFWSRLLAMLLQHWLQVIAWGDYRCSFHKAWQAIQDHATHLASAAGREDQLAVEIGLLGRILAKTSRRDKRKQAGTFELLLDPSLLGYES